MVTANFCFGNGEVICFIVYKIPGNMKFHIQDKDFSETKAKYSLKQTSAGRIHHQQKCDTRNTKESLSQQKEKLYQTEIRIYMKSINNAVVKNLPANGGDAREVGEIPGLGRSP